MKILLISLLPTTENFGIKYIHSYLLENEHHSAILFLPHHHLKVKNSLMDFIKLFNPRLIGCGFMSYEAPFAAYLGRCIKKLFPDLPFLVGGIHPTICPEECLQYADAVSLGESEETVLEIVNNLNNNGGFREIQNLAFKDDGTIRKNPLRPPISDLDRLPFPEHFPPNSYIYHKNKIVPMTLKLFRKHTRYDGKVYNIISSRGCPLSCAYCCNSFLSKLYENKHIRKRTPHNVIEELRSVVKKFPDIIFINIHDDCFLTHSKEWHQEFVKAYKRWIDRPFLIRSTPLHVTEEKIRLLRDAGLAWINMGLQSGCERINKKIFNRNVSNEQFLRATSLVRKYGVSGYYDVILDNPFEEEKDVIHTLRVLKKIPKPFQLELFSLTFYKGTDIYLMMKKKMGEEANLNVKNYFNYRPTFLNKLVRISPLISSKMMDYFIEHREKLVTKILLKFFHFFIVISIEPISYLFLMLEGFNSIWLTLKIAWPTFKTKIRERLMSFDSTFF